MSLAVFDGIQRYCNTLVQPYGNTQIKFCIPSNTLNIVKYWVLQIELVSIHNTVKYPWRTLATIWECIRYCWMPLAALNTQIIFFLNVFSHRHEAAAKDGDHRPFVRDHPFCLFQQISSRYKYTGNYCWQPKFCQIPIWVANIKYRILSNTTKY